MAESKRRREATQIFAEILEICRKLTVRYRIMRGAHLSSGRTLRLLENLVKMKLLKLDFAKKSYEITGKGF